MTSALVTTGTTDTTATEGLARPGATTVPRPETEVRAPSVTVSRSRIVVLAQVAIVVLAQVAIVVLAQAVGALTATAAVADAPTVGLAMTAPSVAPSPV